MGVFGKGMGFCQNTELGFKSINFCSCGRKLRLQVAALIVKLAGVVSCLEQIGSPEVRPYGVAFFAERQSIQLIYAHKVVV